MPDEEVGLQELNPAQLRLGSMTPAAKSGARGDGQTPSEVVAALLQRMAGGDETALILLYSQLSSTNLRVFTSNSRRCRGSQGCDLRDFFSASVRRPNMYDPKRCSAMAWVLTVARRFALDRRKEPEAKGERSRANGPPASEGPGEGRYGHGLAAPRRSGFGLGSALAKGPGTSSSPLISRGSRVRRSHVATVCPWVTVKTPDSRRPRALAHSF